jgi:hypothetical protein
MASSSTQSRAAHALLRATALALSLAAPAALAQDWTAPPYPLAPDRVMSPSVRLSKLPANAPPPNIDGRIDDPAWEHATPLGPLTQQNPHQGAEPSQKTDVRVLYDDHFLYVSVRAWDDEPDKLIAKVMRRDTSQRTDDRVLITIDTFHDKRNGYMFSTNPNSARYEGLIENNQTVRTEWDGIWYAKARVDSKGWTCEFAFPFQTLAFDPAKTTWGFNVTRSVRRLNEESRWASWRQNKFPLDMSEAGTLEGIENVKEGLGLDLIPSGAIGGFRERQVDPLTGDVSHRYFSTVDPSLDAFYKITPSVTGALTVNTDFSDADVDARQVNLDRFALFFPETRDFFLQDAGIFDFGGIGEQTNFNEIGNPNGMPFFSRKIGIYPGGEIVDIRAGAKVTGRVGRLNFGVLDVQMEDPDDIGRKNLSVGRAKWNLGEESSAGVIASYGDPNTPGAGSTLGADFRLRSSHVGRCKTPAQNTNTNTGLITSSTVAVRSGDGCGNVLELIGFAQHTDTSALSRSFRGLPDEAADDEAYGLRVRYPNDLWYVDAGWTRIGEDFDPRLGFVNRPGVDQFHFQGRKRWRPASGYVRFYDVYLESDLVQNLDGHLETLIINPTLIEIHNALDDYVYLGAESRSEVLFDPFTISPGVTIPVDRYNWGRVLVGIGTAQSRPLALFFDYSAGGFFGGHLHSIEANLEWRPSKHFFGQIEYLENKADLPDSFGVNEAEFTQRLVRVRAQYIFTPDLSWDTFVQYDNLTDSVGWNSRVRWILRPGEELSFVWNQGVDVTGHDFRFTATGLTGKLAWTFRF